MDWFSSDLHYGHKNMCLGTSIWKDTSGCRKFRSLEEMNDDIVLAINMHVKENDTFYHLGDWSFGGIENIWKLWDRINCKNIIEILGNHDSHIEKDSKLPNQECYRNGNWVTAQELFKEVHPYLEIKVGKQLIILHHHPIEHWKDAEKGSVMLHGHLHHQMDNCHVNKTFRRMDVGIDWEEFRPFSIDEILGKMNKRPVYERYEE